MNYKLKAFIQNMADALPEQLSHPCYYWLQRHFGTLRRMDPTVHLQKSANIVRNIRRSDVSLEGATCLEIGTGRTFNVAFGLWLCGAERIITVDLNPYLKEELILEAIGFMRDHRTDISRLFEDDGESESFQRRLDRLIIDGTSVPKVMALMGLDYLSPADATQLELADGTVDIHYSCDVFEHIPMTVLRGILHEAKRVLKPGGIVVHHIDLSDHYAHSDPTISSLNFLQFSEELWERLAGNRYMYQNRLRKPEFDALFRETELSILYQETECDREALVALDLPVFKRFAHYSEEELAVTALNIVGHFPTS